VGTGAALELLDLSAPGAPAQVAALPIATSSLASIGTDLFVGTLDRQLVVLDAADPGAPLERARVALPAVPYSLQPAGPGLLLVAAAGAGLLVADVSNPGSPFVRSSLDVGSPAFAVAADGTTAWIAASAGLATADVSDPDRPLLLAQAPLVGYPFYRLAGPEQGLSVAIHQGIAYVGTNIANLFGFDARHPAWPRLVSLGAFGAWGPSPVYLGAMGFDGATAYVAGHFSRGCGLLELNVAQPRNVILRPTPLLGQ
jgi:hypothetical protein